MKNECIAWIKEHKKELAIAGVCIGALILVILIINNPDTVLSLWNSLKK